MREFQPSSHNQETQPERTERDATLEKAYAKAVDTLRDNRINMDSFTGAKGYTQAELNDDFARVRKFQKMDEAKELTEKEKSARILEAIFYDQIQNNAWLGEDVYAKPASLYDDFFGKVDLITEHQEQHMALAIDATEANHVGSKFFYIKNQLESGKLANVKYFQTSTERGRKSGIPHVVIGVSPKVVEELALLWENNETEKLRAHPAQRLILEEIVAQLYTFRDFCDARKLYKYGDMFEKYLSILEPILEEKQDIELGELQNDPSYNAIKVQLASLDRLTQSITAKANAAID